jgi:glycosyltransferase involved in cell wall biosynthesis
MPLREPLRPLWVTFRCAARQVLMEKPLSILFVHNSATQFVRLDLDELRKRYRVTEWYLSSRWVNPLAIWNQVRAHDLVFGWFASWHAYLPIEFARVLRKPSVLVIGGYDVANMPEIGYGHQRGGLKKWMSRRAMRSASRLVTNSVYSQHEAARNVGLSNGRVQAVYHGVPDRFGMLPAGPRARMALTVGNINRSNLARKGHEAFVRTGALLPDVDFVLAGHWQDDAIEYLRCIATQNVTFTDQVSDAMLHDYYRKASVYVQASRHEGFGMSVAEAMLAGCVPVVTRVGALPEVTGDSGIFVDAPEPAVLAEAVKKALVFPDEKRAAIRQRIRDRFPMERRGQFLDELIRPLMNGSH